MKFATSLFLLITAVVEAYAVGGAGFSRTFDPMVVTPQWQGAMRAIGVWAAGSGLEGAKRYRFLAAVDPAHPNLDVLAVVSPFVQALISEEGDAAEFSRIPNGPQGQRILLDRLDSAANAAEKESDEALTHFPTLSPVRSEDTPDDLKLDLGKAIPVARQLQLLHDTGFYPQAGTSISRALGLMTRVLEERQSASIAKILQAANGTAPPMIGTSGGILAAREFAARYAASDCPVLITGETGVGKEVLARLLHHLSGDRSTDIRISNSTI